MAKAFGFGSVSIDLEAVEISPKIEQTKLKLITIGLNYLKENGIDVIAELSKVLSFPDENQIKGSVCYPELESNAEGQAGIPGYTDLVKPNDTATGRENPQYMNEQERRDYLQTPWTPWYNKPRN